MRTSSVFFWAGPLSLGLAAAAGSLSAAADEVETTQNGLAEVTVTAQRRAESSQQVPISVAAFSPDDLKTIGASSTDDLPSMVPGLTLQPTGASRPIFLRGVGNNNNSNVGSAVLIFIDGVYYPYQFGNLPYNNVSSVEVDKGPQGTLFGRNATGGVIQITTRDPQSAPSANLEVGYANFNTQSASAYLTGGLTDRIAADLSVDYSDQKDGWGRNLATGQDIYTAKNLALRDKMLFHFSADTQLRLTFDYLTSDANGNSGIVFVPAVNYPNLFNEVTRQPFPISGRYNADSNYQPGYTVRQMGASARFDTSLGALRGVSITSWHTQRTSLYIDYDGTPTPFFNIYRFDNRSAETQEFQLLSAEDSLIKWVSGLYFYNDTGRMQPFQFGGIGGSAVFRAPAGEPFDIVASDRVTSYAAFGQATIPLPSNSDLTLGARYTIDQRYIDGYTMRGPAISPGSGGQLSKAFRKPTYRVMLDHHFTNDLMAYVSYNRGFNSGYFNQVSVAGFGPGADPAVNPEIMDAYEIGEKSEWLDHRLRLNTSGFWYQYKNLQQQVYEGSALVTVNAAAARIRGLDVELEARPATALTLAAGLEYLDAKFISYPNAPIYSIAPNGALVSAPGDAAGDNIPYAPKYSYNIRGTYDIASPIGDFSTTAALSYTGSWYGDPGNLYRQPGRALVNVSETWTSSEGRASVSAWAKNVGNKYYDAGINVLSPVGVIGGAGGPRTYGVTVGYRF